MPPASPGATPVWRMASSNEVLPWSTWPMTVTTGGRGFRSSSESWYTTAYSSSGDTTRTLRPMSSAMSSISSSLMVWVSVSAWPSRNRRLMTSFGLHAEQARRTSATVAPCGISTTESSSTSVGSRPRLDGLLLDALAALGLALLLALLTAALALVVFVRRPRRHGPRRAPCRAAASRPARPSGRSDPRRLELRIVELGHRPAR